MHWRNPVRLTTKLRRGPIKKGLNMRNETTEQPSVRPSPAARGSAWERVNAVMADAAKLEELTKLRMERPGETFESAFAWAKEMYQRYSPNGELSDRTPNDPN